MHHHQSPTASPPCDYSRWSRRSPFSPALIARCRNTAEVLDAVNAARHAGLERPLRRVLVLLAVAAGLLVAPAAASAAVPGLEQVIRATSANDSRDGKSAQALCPPGKVVLGGGAEIRGGRGQVLVDDQAPNASRTAFVATGYEDADGTELSWSVRAHAICADPLPGYDVVEKSSDPGSPPFVNVSAFCEGDTRLLGPGGRLFGARGQASMSRIEPFSSSLPGTALQAREFRGGSERNWLVTAVAICADPPAGLEPVVREGARSSENKSISARCPAGKRLLGAGGAVRGFEDNVAIDVIPQSSAGGDRVTVSGVESQDGENGTWFLTAHAICAPV